MKTTKHRAFNTNVIVKEVLETEAVSAGGFILKTENYGRAEGILEHLGSNAFEDFGEHKPKIGDRIVYARYAGKELTTYSDGFTRRILKDLDVLCSVEEVEE